MPPQESMFVKRVERLFPLIHEQAPWAAIAAAISVVAQAIEKLPVWRTELTRATLA